MRRRSPSLLSELLQVGTIGGTEAVQVQIPAVAQGFLRAQKCLRCVLAVVTGEAYTLLAPGHPAPGTPIQDRSRLPLRSHDFADVCERYLAEFIQQSLHGSSFSIAPFGDVPFEAPPLPVLTSRISREGQGRLLGAKARLLTQRPQVLFPGHHRCAVDRGLLSRRISRQPETKMRKPVRKRAHWQRRKRDSRAECRSCQVMQIHGGRVPLTH